MDHLIKTFIPQEHGILMTEPNQTKETPQAGKGISIFISKKEVQQIVDKTMDWESFYIRFVTKIHTKLSKMKCDYNYNCTNLAYKEGVCKEHWINTIQDRLVGLNHAEVKLTEDPEIPDHLIQFASNVLKEKYRKELKRLGVKDSSEITQD